MTKSYKKDIQLLMSILQRQNDIKEVKVNKKYLKVYIFSIIESKAITEVKNRINFVMKMQNKISV